MDKNINRLDKKKGIIICLLHICMYLCVCVYVYMIHFRRFSHTSKDKSNMQTSEYMNQVMYAAVQGHLTKATLFPLKCVILEYVTGLQFNLSPEN